MKKKVDCVLNQPNEEIIKWLNSAYKEKQNRGFKYAIDYIRVL